MGWLQDGPVLRVGKRLLVVRPEGTEDVQELSAE